MNNYDRRAVPLFNTAEAIGLNPSDVLSRRGAFDHGFPPLSPGKTDHPLHRLLTPDIGAVLDNLAVLLEAGAVEVAIWQRFDLASVDEAQRAMMDESFIGKVVMTP